MRYQWREIGEGQEWVDCDNDWYEHCQKSPEHDTRILKKLERCSPVEMRKNLETVEILKGYGIDFVPVPVRDQDHKNELLALGNEILEELSKAI